MSKNVSLFIPGDSDAYTLTITPGKSIVFVGANGSGKTRLAVYLEESLREKAHRISAHRALTLNPDVPKISEQKALLGLRIGHDGIQSNINDRVSQRWHRNPAVALLNDFDYLVQVLFAEQSNTALRAYNNAKPGENGVDAEFRFTKFDTLKDIWARLLPHRNLCITGDDIQVIVPNSDQVYKASEMSDGERAIFYLIGQVLVAKKNCIFVVDEPELHVHRSIMSKLWDDLKAARSDCAFVFISHDLEFAASRVAQRFLIKEFTKDQTWNIEEVPEDSGFGEELMTLILGSRKPILFVEGDKNSLDYAIYRCCYPDWTVIPSGSCLSVIHSVSTLRKNSCLTRVQCQGIVDADNYDSEYVKYFEDNGVHVLPVAEIENLMLLPDVSSAIAKQEGYGGEELTELLDELANDVFDKLRRNDEVEGLAVRYCLRKLDLELKTLDVSTVKSVSEINQEVKKRVENLQSIADTRSMVKKIKTAVRNRDLKTILQYYDNKGLMALAAKHLKKCKKRHFVEWLMRVVGKESDGEVARALRSAVPELSRE